MSQVGLWILIWAKYPFLPFFMDLGRESNVKGRLSSKISKSCYKKVFTKDGEFSGNGLIANNSKGVYKCEKYVSRNCDIDWADNSSNSCSYFPWPLSSFFKDGACAPIKIPEGSLQLELKFLLYLILKWSSGGQIESFF